VASQEAFWLFGRPGHFYLLHIEGDSKTNFFMKEMPRENNDPEVCALKELWKQGDLLHVIKVADDFTVEDEEGEFGYLVLEFAPGGDLESVVGGWDCRETRVVLGEMARAVAEVHLLGLIHGDIKLNNFVHGKGGTVKLIDFESASCVLSEDRRPWGTPGYNSPEKRRGEWYGRASDVWSLGVAMFRLYEGHGLSDDDFEIYNGPGLFTNRTPSDVQDLILGMLKPDPQDRLTAEEILGHAALKAE
jgi:serine/threonine protein kinase